MAAALRLPPFCCLRAWCAQQAAPSVHEPSAHELAQRVDRHYNGLHSLPCGVYGELRGPGDAADRERDAAAFEAGQDALGLQLSGRKAVSAGRQVRVVERKATRRCSGFRRSSWTI